MVVKEKFFIFMFLILQTCCVQTASDQSEENHFADPLPIRFSKFIARCFGCDDDSSRYDIVKDGGIGFPPESKVVESKKAEQETGAALVSDVDQHLHFLGDEK
jgi:hypothetical protein